MLESATVSGTVIAGQEAEGGAKPLSSSLSPAVQMTSHYGPVSLCGLETQLVKKKIKRLVLSLQVLNLGVGGLGVEDEKAEYASSRWQFRGFTKSAYGNHWCDFYAQS